MKFVCSLGVALSFILASLASAQINYLTQSRIVTNNGPTLTAPDFGPFSAALGSSFDSDWAQQTSTLSAQILSANMYCVDNGDALRTQGRGAAIFKGSTFTVTFSVPADTRFGLTATVDKGSMSLVGPGVSIGVSSGTITQFGTLKAGQTYTCDAIVSTSGVGLNKHTCNFQVWLSSDVATSFFYQGTLGESGQAISSPADMQFALFRTSDSTVNMGPEIDANAVQVHNGVFTQELDFGDVFDGSDRWLEIRVRHPAGSGAFTTISPRAKIASVPHSVRARLANDALKLNGQQAAFYQDAGNLNAGTLPDARLSANVARTNATATFVGPEVVAPASVGTWISNGSIQLVANNGTVPSIDFSRTPFVDYHARIGMASSNTLSLTANTIQVNGTFMNNSDARDKHDVRDIADPMGLIDQLRGVRYRWNDRSINGGHLPPGEQVGFLAQDVERVLPELVATGDDGTKAVSYVGIVPLLTEGMKVQQNQIEKLKAENAVLRERLERIEKRMDGK